MATQDQQARSAPAGGASEQRQSKALGQNGPMAGAGPMRSDPNRVTGAGGQSRLEGQRDSRSPSAMQKLKDAGRGTEENPTRGPTAFLGGLLQGIGDRLQNLGGETGIVATESGRLHLRDGPGMDESVLEKLPAGTVMTQHAQMGEWKKVKVWSGFEGKEGWVHADYFQLEPDLTKVEEGDRKGEPDSYVYEEVTGRAFHGKPRPAEAEQGSIGDCYFIAAMIALASRPGGQKALMDMVKPHGPARSYEVTFREEQRDGSFRPVSFKVSAWLPTKGGKLKYALGGFSTGDLSDVPLWPAIIEKAYAQWKGGYDQLDEGGSSRTAMAELAGVDTAWAPIKRVRDDDELHSLIRGLWDDGKAVVCGSKDELDRRADQVLSGRGKGPYTGSLENSLIAGTLRIEDQAGKAATLKDDGKGNLAGADEAQGTIDYKKGRLRAQFGGSGPADADDLVVHYTAKRWLSDQPKICGNHAYVVEGVPDGGVQLRNPWGSWHPGFVPISTFRKCFYGISTADLGPEDAPT